MIEQGVLNLLLGSPTAVGSRPDGTLRSAIQAAVAAAVGSRVYPSKAPQGSAYPYLIVRKTGAQHTKALQGVAGLAFTSVTVETYAVLYKDAEALADNVRRLLDGYRGALANGLSCQAILQDDDANNWQQPVHSDEQGVEAVELHLRVVHNEA